MNWRDSKWCDVCGAAPHFVAPFSTNPNLHLYRCSLCGRDFEYDTWTKAAKEKVRDGHHAE